MSASCAFHDASDIPVRRSSVVITPDVYPTPMTLPSGLVVMQCIVPSSKQHDSSTAIHLTNDKLPQLHTSQVYQQATIVRSTQHISQYIPFTELVSERFNVLTHLVKILYL